jgi:signal transduction histidine kinase
MDNAQAITDWLNELRYHQLLNLTTGLNNSMSTLVDALQVGLLATTDDNLTELIPAMKHSVEQARQLILVLINLEEPDNHSPCSLKTAIEQAKMFFAHSLVRRQINLVVSGDTDLMIPVPFDITVFALANLIGNAKDAVGEGGGIIVKAEINNDLVVCQVADEGKGVAPELRETLFEEGTTTKEKGKGKGLFLTRKTLGHCGATIELTKTDECGSLFTIFFPKYM